jgi:phosphohistidine swiveling domain-containing protein
MEEEEQKPIKRKQAPAQIVSPMFVMTPALERMAQEHADKLLAEKKEKQAQYIQERDEKLKVLGLDKCDEYYVEKIAAVKAIAGEAEDIVEKEAEIGLEEIQVPSVAGASGSVSQAADPEFTSVADNSIKVTQISEPFITISHVEPSIAISHVEPSSSKPPATEDTAVLDNLESHYKGELPGVTLHKASEVTSEAVVNEEVISESPQQQPPEPQMTSTSQIPQPPNTQINPQMAPSTSSSQILSEQTVPEQTTFIKPT